jgi:hypothetical protein
MPSNNNENLSASSVNSETSSLDRAQIVTARLGDMKTRVIELSQRVYQHHLDVSTQLAPEDAAVVVQKVEESRRRQQELADKEEQLNREYDDALSVPQDQPAIQWKLFMNRNDVINHIVASLADIHSYVFNKDPSIFTGDNLDTGYMDNYLEMKRNVEDSAYLAHEHAEWLHQESQRSNDFRDHMGSYITHWKDEITSTEHDDPNLPSDDEDPNYTNAELGNASTQHDDATTTTVEQDDVNSSSVGQDNVIVPSIEQGDTTVTETDNVVEQDVTSVTETDNVVEQDNTTVTETDNVVEQNVTTVTETDNAVEQDDITKSESDNVVKQDDTTVTETDKDVKQDDTTKSESDKTEKQESKKRKRDDSEEQEGESSERKKQKTDESSTEVKNTGSLIDDYADISTEFPGYTDGDD